MKPGGGGPFIPRRADAEKQNWGVSGGKEEGWVITSELACAAAFAGDAASLDRTAEFVHKMPASVSDTGDQLKNRRFRCLESELLAFGCCGSLSSNQD